MIIYFFFIWATKEWTYILISKLLTWSLNTCHVRISSKLEWFLWCTMVLFCYGLCCSSAGHVLFWWPESFWTFLKWNIQVTVLEGKYFSTFFLAYWLCAWGLRYFLQGCGLLSAAGCKLRSSLGNLSPWVEVEKNTFKYLQAFESCSYLRGGCQCWLLCLITSVTHPN